MKMRAEMKTLDFYLIFRLMEFTRFPILQNKAEGSSQRTLQRHPPLPQQKQKARQKEGCQYSQKTTIKAEHDCGNGKEHLKIQCLDCGTNYADTAIVQLCVEELNIVPPQEYVSMRHQTSSSSIQPSKVPCKSRRSSFKLNFCPGIEDSIKLGCVSCRHFWQLVKTYSVFVLTVFMFAFNSFRSIPLILQQEELNVTMALEIVYSLMWIEHFIQHVAHSFGIRKRIDHFASHMRRYETRFGFSFDVPALNSRLRKTGSNCYTVLFTTMILVPFIMFYSSPDSRKHLAPFQDSEGIIFILACVAYGIILALTLQTSVAVAFAVAQSSYILRTEFLHVASEIEKILSVFDTDDIDLDRLQTGETLFYRDQYSDQLFSEMDENVCSSERGGSSLEYCTLPSQTIKPFTAATVCGKRGHNRALTQTTFKDVKVGGKIASHLISGLPGNSSAAKVYPTKTTLNSASSVNTTFDPACAMETTLDRLLRRHETLCSLVHSWQCCFNHTVPVASVFTIAIVCFVVFAAATGSLRWTELPTLLFGLASIFAFTLVALAVVCSVYESAKAILRPILYANKTQLPQTLLQKMQLTVQRLTTEEVGYHVYGLFVVSRPTILMMGGTVLTYTVVVVQFQMGAVCTCSSGYNVTAV